MNTILGASGQIGFMVIENLIKLNQPVTAVIRNERKAEKLIKLGAKVKIADYYDVDSLSTAFEGSSSVFLLTPEIPSSENFVSEAENLINIYKKAILNANVKRVIGLSTLGAQHKNGTGNLQVSYNLEHMFDDNEDIAKTFIRPAYYYSNWMFSAEYVSKNGVLPTYFPKDLKIPMVAPSDVANFIASVISNKEKYSEMLYEVVGPESYSPADIAFEFSNIYKNDVSVNSIKFENWKTALTQLGFSEKNADNFILMTQAVMEGRANPEFDNPIVMPMTFKDFLSKNILNSN